MESQVRIRLSTSLLLVPMVCMIGAPALASEKTSWLENLLQKATSAITRQEQAEQVRQVDKAYQLILQNLAKDPQNVQLLTAVVKQLGGSFKWQEAEPYMRRILAVDPFNEANIEYAEYLAGKDQTREQAVAILQGVLSKHHGNKRAQRDFALMGAWYPHSSKQATTMLETLHAENPNDVEVLTTLARVNRWRTNDLTKAEKYYKEYLAKYSNDVAISIELAGTLNEQKGKQSEAVALVNKLVAQYPTNDKVRLARAQILTNAKQMRQALPDVEFLAKKDPFGITWDGYINGHSRRIPIVLVAAQFANFSGKSKLSQQYYKQFLAKFPNDVDASTELRTVIANSLPPKPVRHFVAPPPPKPDPVQVALNNAHDLQVAGKTDEAIALLEDLEREHPGTKCGALVRWEYQKDQPLDLLIAQYAVEAKQYDKAESAYKHYLESHSDDSAVRLDLSDLQSLQGKNSSSVENLKQVVEAAPDMQTFVYTEGETKRRAVTAALAQKLMLQHQYQEAKPYYESYLKANPEDEQMHREYKRMLSYERSEKREKAFAMKRDGKQDDAQRLLEALLNEDGSDLETAIALAEIRAKDDPAAADKLIDEYMKANPSADRFAIAERFAWPKPTRKIAERLLRETLRLEPENDKALLLLGHLESWDESNTQRAIRDLDEYLKRHPEDSQAKKDLAGLLLWRGDPRRSSQLYEDLLAKKPNDLDLLLGLARAQHADKRKMMKESAADTMLRYLSQKPQDAEAKRELANWYCYDGKPKESIRLYDELLRQSPDDVDLMNGKAQVLALSGKVDPGLRLYRAVLVKDPANHDALLGLAQVLGWTGDHFAAERVLKVAREKYGSDKLVQLETALNYRAMGRLDKADYYVKKSLSSL